MKIGIDIGSTTVKVVVLNRENDMIYGEYRRHHAKTQETLKDLLKEVYSLIGNQKVQVRITGSGSINMSKALGVEFVQEVVAVADAIQLKAPQTDVAIELGGEDAKIIYFTNGLEERMNGVCAGGTGSFIDQMASLLQTDAQGLNEYAKAYKQIYPIAARCGVFAKTDIQPLINEGATKEDLAASIFQAVVNQTISGLACGKPIRGCVAFLGGPLHYLSELKKAFIRTLKLTDENIVDSDQSHLFAAMGAALNACEQNEVELDSLIEKLESKLTYVFEMPRLEPLFKDQEEYLEFQKRHAKNTVKKEPLESYQGNCFLGIDAGSTTTKAVLIGDQGQLLYSFYANNQGNPIETAKKAMAEIKTKMSSHAQIARACSTGYGELLLKSAFSLDEGVVETIAHTTGASFFMKDVDCVLDIGGQDMKYIRLKDGAIENIMLNEACSSGCGSFIENFATSLGLSVEEFAKEALFSKSPVDLGTRCTVFMNSNVKQAQKEGTPVSDISAGLAYSVIKNALYKVIKVTSVEELGKNIVVQGGTFHNHAVLRAIEKILKTEVINPDISGVMGAFGAALIAKENFEGQPSTMLSLDEILNLNYTTRSIRCQGCLNHCMLTINRFSNDRQFISGNRCEKGLGQTIQKKKVGNIVEYKRKRLFDSYIPLDKEKSPRGVIGIPRVLNMYENYPFWATFFKQLGFSVVLSPYSSKQIYELGMESIPSESECYPAKLAHGHVEWLIQHGVKRIFHPCVFYEKQEVKAAQNHYNCPIVVSYAENIKNNVEAITNKEVIYYRPFVAFTDEKTITERLVKYAKETWDIPVEETEHAVHRAWQEQRKAKLDILRRGKQMLVAMENSHTKGIVLAGRPYHIDPEINHGIPEMIASYGLYVFTEDSLPMKHEPTRPLRVVDQWVYHSRLYSAAEFVCQRDDLELVQLNSFGCGLDAVTTDQVSEILRQSNKLYTLLKIDEVNNLGAVKIRVRSLLEAMKMREKNEIKSTRKMCAYQRTEFTQQMFDDHYTILAPQMSPIHFELLEPVFRKHGFNIVVLDNDHREAIDTGLKYVNNDACFPSMTVVGQIMDAILSGKYDTSKLAVIMAQTGGCCRASNYVSFIRRALEKEGLSFIPVISFNANGMEKNEGFKLPKKLIVEALQAVVYGDLLMKCLYRVRPYEYYEGSANGLYQDLSHRCIEVLKQEQSHKYYRAMCRTIVKEFDEFPIHDTLKKPRVGIVGEILVKYMPLANNHLVEVLEKEGAEAVVPDLMDFANYSLYNNIYKSEYLGEKKSGAVISNLGIKLIRWIRKPAVDALKHSKRFEPSMNIEKIAEQTKPFLSIGNQYGEGWFLTGEMIELIKHNVPNIVCIQPFACLPNHVVGKGVIKSIRKEYPEANIVAIDYDPGASEVNQLNRIKLMLSTAQKRMHTQLKNQK